MQERLVDVWKKNILKNLEAGVLEYKIVREFLADLRTEFGEEDKKMTKAVELKRLEQEERTIEKFMQKFKRVARGSRYKGWPLIKEFKKVINGIICQRLIVSEWQPTSIQQ